MRIVWNSIHTCVRALNLLNLTMLLHMKFKRIFLVLSAACMFAGIASAQQSKADKTVEFNPHWYIQLQGGAGYTVGETTDFATLVSPAASLNFGYNFTPVTGLRVGLGGWQGKGYHVFQQTDYSFKYGQLTADAMFNLCNLFGGYNHKRVVSVVPFIGVGAYLGLENEAAAGLISSRNENMRYLWEPVKPFFGARAGLQFDFRLTDNLSLNLEGVANGIDDHFNSKDGDNIDWQIDALLGLTYRFGATTRASKAYADELALADALAAAAAAEKAAALAKEQADKDIAAAKKAADDKVAKAEAQAKAEALKLQQELAAAYAKPQVNVFFELNKSKIQESEEYKIDLVVAYLLTNPDAVVELVGYADKNTGTPRYNKALSDRRAKAVAKYIKAKGISAKRIVTDHKGDTVQPFAVNEENRVVICTVE